MFKKLNDIDVDLNYVDKYNFNQTLKGYLIRACKGANLTEQETNVINGAMNRALDDMTAMQAREEYEESIR